MHVRIDDHDDDGYDDDLDDIDEDVGDVQSAVAT